ncbi:alpha-hydroxy acid oxidase [Arthrobacter sp. GCM10027362]|uniref:alpha-hydroxy acid oxidase n=1 Tax=Arthrobacter sp. GCM10027362 TaxID=3273379 RepID=UPI003643E086
MKLSSALDLVSFTLPAGSAAERALARCHTVEDLRRLAARRLPRTVMDYIDGGADAELSLAGNTEAFARYRFTPAVLADVSAPDTATDFLGRTAAAPLGFAPTGFTRMINPDGEPAVARSAAAAGLPYVLSTMATTSLEDLAAQPAGDRWFQLYAWKDRARTLDLIRRAADAGYRVLELAVDTAVPGNRLRDVRSGFTIPPRLTASSLLDIGSKPGYWTKLLRAPDLEFANLSGGAADCGHGYTIENIGAQFNPALDWAGLAGLRAAWPGKLLLKGPVGPADAVRARDFGVDGVHLSNHGGRQLDRTVAPADLIAPVRQAVGEDFAVVVDSGIRHGADIAVALALGADLAMVGRPYLWALAAGGEAGVGHLADLLVSQFRRTMALLGVAGVAGLRRAGPQLLAGTPNPVPVLEGTP